jgi:molybdenum cofactor cytidylyltransferase
MVECAVVADERYTSMQIAAIVLAAGGSVRMGQPKQLLPIGGQPMVRRVVEAVCGAGLDQVVVVTGAYAAEVRQALAGLNLEMIFNESWSGGLSTSLRHGIKALRPEIGAVLIVLADQPALTPGLLEMLVARYRATGAPIVAPVHRGRRGNPVLFARTVFSELLAVEGDQGGRAFLARHADRLEQVEVDDPAVLFDVDTLHDYEEAKKLGTER